MGGFVGSAALAASEVESELLNATRTAGWDKERELNTLTAIRDGIKAGQTKPLEAPARPANVTRQQRGEAAYADALAGGVDDERAAIQGEAQGNVVPIAGAKVARGGPPTEAPLPNDVPREDALIATLMFREGSFDECASIAKPEHFYRASNGAALAAIAELSDQGCAYTPRDVANLWSSKGEGSRAAELERLSDDRLLIPMTAIRREAEVIRDLYRQREMIKACEEAARKGRQRTPDVQGYLDEALYSIDRAAEPPTMANVGTAAELAASFIDRFEAALQRNGAMKGVPSQLRQFDRALGGLIKKSQIVFAGRPSMGKTAAACQIGMNVAVQPDADGVKRNGVLIFSLETTKEDLTDRMIFTIAGMCVNDLDTGRLVKVISGELLRKCNAADRAFFESNPDELRRAGEEEARRRRNDAAVVFAALPLYVHHQDNLTLAEMKATIRFQRAMWKRQGIRLALVIVDYLQLIEGRNLVSRGASREQEVGAVAKATRQLAQKEDFPLLILAQLNRAVEKQKDKRPTLADLRESGQIEMHADTVVFCHREEKYFGEECPEEWKNLAEFVIAKNKNGPTCTAWVGFHGPSMTFIDTPKSDARAYND
jgi:replicative DNA helicase